MDGKSLRRLQASQGENGFSYDLGLMCLSSFAQSQAVFDTARFLSGADKAVPVAIFVLIAAHFQPVPVAMQLQHNVTTEQVYDVVVLGAAKKFMFIGGMLNLQAGVGDFFFVINRQQDVFDPFPELLQFFMHDANLPCRLMLFL